MKNTIKFLVITVLGILLQNNISAQYSVSGDGSVDVGETKRYSIIGSGLSIAQTSWFANGGTIVSSPSSTATYVDVRWDTPGNRYVGVTIWYVPFDSVPDDTLTQSVFVIGTDPPTIFTLTNMGPSSVCDDEGSVRLSNSQSGATYRLYRNGALSGPSRSGSDNNSLTWTNLSSGTYTVRATMNGFTRTMNGSISLAQKVPVPVAIGINGDPNINTSCPTRVGLSAHGTSSISSWEGVDGYFSGITTPFIDLALGQSKMVILNAEDECGTLRRISKTITARPATSNARITLGPEDICQGTVSSVYNASASNATDYVWTILPSNAATSIVGSGSSATVTWNQNYTGNSATIRVTASGDCPQTSSDTQLVTFDDPPAIYNLISASSEVCTTGTLTLQGSQTKAEYTLRRDDGSIVSTKDGTGGPISWSGAEIVPDTYRVTARNKSDICSEVTMNGSVSLTQKVPASVAIGINGDPNISTSCPTRVGLSAHGTSSISSWEGVDGYFSGITTPFIDLDLGQSKTVILNAEDECGTLRRISKTITARPATSNASIISGLSAICEGTISSDYEASASNATEYEWTILPSNAATSIVGSGSSATVTWNQNFTGSNATITVTASGNCPQTSSYSLPVTFSDPPEIYDWVPDSREVCPGGTTTLALSNSQTGVDYQLYLNGSPIRDEEQGSNGNRITWNGLGIGTYSVVAMNANGSCSGVTMDGPVTITDRESTPIELSLNRGEGSDLICPGRVYLSVNVPDNGNNIIWYGIDGEEDGFDRPRPYVDVLSNTSRSVGVEVFVCGVGQRVNRTITGKPVPYGAEITRGPGTICQGTISSDYEASASNATSYNWSINPPTAGQIEANESITTVRWDSGFYGDATIRVVAEGDCGESEDTFPVYVDELIPFYEDRDKDGWYVSIEWACTNPDPDIYVTGNQVEGSGDCNDEDPKIKPDVNWYVDGDGDGFRDPDSTPVKDCFDRGAGWTTNIEVDACPDRYDVENLCPPPASTDPETHNYIYTRTYQNPVSTLPANKFLNEDAYIQQITFYDGLGRPIQENAIRQNPNGKDIVTHIGYDGYGRREKEWLPITNTGQSDGYGHFTSGDLKVTTRNYYHNHQMYAGDFVGLLEEDVNPYSQKYFEPSPLNRILKQAAPGADWALAEDENEMVIPQGGDHSIEFAYGTNTHNPLVPGDSGNDNVRWFSVTTTSVGNTYVPTLVYGDYGSGDPIGYYATGELYKNSTRDENHASTGSAIDKLHTTEEFMDKQGRTVLKRTYADLSPLGGDTEGAHDTYYVYDDYGNLSYVLPPKMEGSTATLAEINSAMDELGYQYVYDHRNRLVEKKLPGKGWEYIVYNRLDQPILTQDANQRDTGTDSHEWLFTKYDAFGRVAYTGKATSANTVTRTEVQDDVDALTAVWEVHTATLDASNDYGGTTVHYTNGAYPNNSTSNRLVDLNEVLTINYYDGYDAPWAEMGASVTSFGIGSTANVKGLATGSKVKTLDVAGSEVWTTTATYYDEKARPIYTHTRNAYLGTVDIIATKLDFVGHPQNVRTAHTRNGTTIVTLDNFTYDHVGRLLSQTQCIGDATLGDTCNSAAADTSLVFSTPVTGSRTDIATSSIILRPGFHVVAAPGLSYTAKIEAQFTQELIVYNDYDALGQLVHKKVGGTPGTDFATTAGLQTVDYAYNVRGWLTDINNVGNTNKLFNFSIGYNQGPNPLYNGNISQTQWRTANSDDSSLKSYDYTYDALNRITQATDNTGYFNLGSPTNPAIYDKNGNILKLFRLGHVSTMPNLADNAMDNSDYGIMDQLGYAYHNSEASNRLYKIRDDGADLYGFADSTADVQDYWYDGNGNMTADANKGITSILYNHLNLPTQVSFDSGGTINYVYDAAGTKLKKTVSTGAVTEYSGNHVYSGNLSSTALQFFNHPEGYVNVENSNYRYVYQYKDHVGNVRLSYTDDPSNPGTPTIIEESNYYPFGLEHKGYNGSINGRENNYQTYLGQEINKELGLDWLSFRHRNYMPEIGRFFGVDPVAGDYVNISPYQFAHNNPVWKIELEGLEGQERQGFDVINAPPSGQSGQNPSAHLPLPIGDQTSGTTSGDKNTRKLVAIQKHQVVTGYPGQAMEEAVTSGIQWLGSKITGDDVSEETAGNVELGIDILVTITSKGKKGGNLLERLFKSGDDIVENKVKKSNIKNAKPDRPELPSLDATGKVHGDLIDPKDFSKYSPDELKQLNKELKQSVQQRIKKTSELGSDKGHGQRQGAEQDLIKSIEKYLDNLK